MQERLLQSRGPEVLKTTDGLAVVISTGDHHKKAEKMIRDVIGRMKEVLGPDHPEILTAPSNVATVLFGQRKKKQPSSS